MVSGFSYGTFTSLNSSTSTGSISSTNALNYLDDVTGKGRRVDLNIFPRLTGSSPSFDLTLNGSGRCVL